MIHVGSEEVLLDNPWRDWPSRPGATLDVSEQMIHVWRWFLPWLDETQAGVEKIGGFLRSRLRVGG